MAYAFKKLTKAEFQEIAYGVGGEFNRVWTECEASVGDGHKKVYYDNELVPDLDLTTDEGKCEYMKRSIADAFNRDDQEVIAFYLDDYLVYLEKVTITGSDWYVNYHLIGKDKTNSKAWWHSDDRKDDEKTFFTGLGSVTKSWHFKSSVIPSVDEETDGKKMLGWDVDASDITIGSAVTWYSTNDYRPYTFTWGS